MLQSKLALGIMIGLLILAAVILGLYQIYNINKVHVITIAAGSLTNDTHIFADELANVVAEAEPNIQLDVVETDGSKESAELVQSGTVDLGILQMEDEGSSQARIVALLYPEVFHLVVRTDSTIQTPADLKGKTVATAEDIFPDVLAYYDIPEGAVTLMKFEEGEEAEAAFLNGEADAVFRWSEPGSDDVTKLVQEGQGRLIPFSQFESMRLTVPYLAEFTIPRGLYQAGNPTVPSSDLITVGSYKALVANAKMDPKLVRTITRILFEYQNRLVARIPLAIYLRSPANTQMVGPALHPGAQAYYDKDKPTLFQRYESEISFLFSAGPILASILLALWAKTQNQHQVRAKLHIQAVHNALMLLAETGNGQNAEDLEQRLLRILAKFTKDLKDGNITSEDAQAFSMIWDKAITIARHRKRLADLSTS